MPRSARLSAIRCLAFALGAARCATTLPAQSAGDTTYHLHGTVRDGLTNKPIGHALVTSGDRRLATMTDGEGHFNIDVNVPAPVSGGSTVTAGAGQVTGIARFGGSTTLIAHRPGYLVPDQQTALTADDSLNTTDFTLKLMPAATIAGRVTASDSDSPRGVRVMLLRHQVIEGVYTWAQAGFHTTGSGGEFRFSNLQPGEYTVMTAEWAGGEPLAMQRSSVTRQYPPDFLGNAPTLAGAARVHLRYGSEEHAELQLRAANYYPVVVPVQNQPPNSPISVRIGGGDTFNGYQLGWNARDGAIEGSLPSGEYSLLINSFGPHQGSALVPLTVANRPLEHAPVTLADGTNIPIRVRLEFAQPPTVAPGTGGHDGERGSWVQLYLRPAEAGGSFVGNSVRHGEGSEQMLENVQPGTYFIHANANYGYIASMTSGGVDLLRHPLTIGDGGSADPIDVTLRDDGGTVEGTLKTDAGTPPTTFASLLLVPTDGSALVQQSYAMPNGGKFTLRNVPPGSYRLFATIGSNSLRQLPYRDAAAMRAYIGKGAAVTVAAGQTATADAAVIDAAEIAQ